ncbi:MAG: hypothetical protein DRJ52_09835 [Thermoprotei archaeon]|nr:MAG: hypothetical protein DRJ52_09835 [Thermoprotei archaeon]
MAIILDKLREYRVHREREKWAGVLAAAVSASPYPPASTLLELRELGLDFLPKTPRELLLEAKTRKFKELVEECKQAQLMGRKDSIKYLAEKYLNDIKNNLVTLDIHVMGFSEILGWLGLFAPLFFLCSVIFVPLEQVKLLIMSSLIISIIVSLLFFSGKTPREFSLPSPPPYYFLPLLFTPIALLVLPLSVSLLVTSAITAVLLYFHQKKLLSYIDIAERIISRATGSNLFPIVLGRKLRPRDLLSKKFWGFAGILLKALYLLLTCGSEKYYENASRLLDFFKEYKFYMNRFREKASATYFYALIFVGITGLSIAWTYSMYIELSQISVPTGEIGAISIPDVRSLDFLIDATLVAASLSFSLAEAVMRDGNPLYFPLYTPLLLLTAYSAFYIGVNYIKLV